MNRARRLLAVFLTLTPIFQIGQASNDEAVERFRTFKRRWQDGNGGTGIDDIVNSLAGLVDIPVNLLNFVSGGLSPPVTLSGDLLDNSGLASTPIVGPVSGTLVAGLEAFLESPTTIRNSLCGGLDDIIDGLSYTLWSPMTISSDASDDGLQGILYSPLQVVPSLSGTGSEVLAGILRVVSSPLTISAQALDVGVDLSVDSLRGLLPESLEMTLPASISRGIEALITSPLDLARYFGEGYDMTLKGFFGDITSPLKVLAAILQGKLNLHTSKPLIYPAEIENPISSIGGLATSPAYTIHALKAQTGIFLAGILRLVSSPLLVSGDILEETLFVDTVSASIYPEESDIAQPSSFYQGVVAVVNSPMRLLSIISDSSHLLVDGVLGLFASPINVLSGLSPIPFPGSANKGIGGFFDSHFDFAELTAANFGYALAGFIGLIASPVTLSDYLLRESVNFNPESLKVLPRQMENWGFPESIATGVTSFLEVPYDGLTGIIEFLSSPLAIIDAIGIANVPGSPNAPPIFPLDFPDELPAEDLPPYNPNNPASLPTLSGKVIK